MTIRLESENGQKGCVIGGNQQETPEQTGVDGNKMIQQEDQRRAGQTANVEGR